MQTFLKRKPVFSWKKFNSPDDPNFDYLY